MIKLSPAEMAIVKAWYEYLHVTIYKSTGGYIKLGLQR